MYTQMEYELIISQNLGLFKSPKLKFLGSSEGASRLANWGLGQSSSFYSSFYYFS